MIVIKHNWGMKVIIHETDYNSELEYRLRQVRVLNDDCKEEQELIAEIEKQIQDCSFEYALRSKHGWRL